MKKYRLTTGLLIIIQFILMISAVILNHFTETKMGMMRHVMFKNQWFESTLFTKTGIFMLICFTLILILFNIYVFIKNGLKDKLFTVINLAILMAAVIFIKRYNATEILSYYYILTLITAITVVELIKLIVCAICIKRNQNSK